MSKFTKTTLCENHDLLLNGLNKAIKLIPTSYAEDPELRDELLMILSECQDLLNKAKAQGNSMEIRLRCYRLAIEKLGFERKNNE